MNLDDALLAFYRLTEKFEGIPPTTREFQQELGLSSASVARYRLVRLEDAGLIHIPAALRRGTVGQWQPYEGARTRKLSAKGLQRAYLLTERVA